MGLLSTTLGDVRAFGSRDEELIWNLIQVMNKVDGVVEPSELQVAEALSRTVPQLRAGTSGVRPTLTRKSLLDELGKLEDEALRRQLYVIAVEVALASGGVNESEDQYTDLVRRALRIDDAFAKLAVQIIGCKYARALK